MNEAIKINLRVNGMEDLKKKLDLTNEKATELSSLLEELKAAANSLNIEIQK